MPDIGRALGRLVAGRGSPARPGQLRDGLAAARALRSELELEPDRPDLLVACCRASAAMARWSTSWRARWCRRRRSMPPRAATSPRAMTPRSTRCARRGGDGRRAIAALEARYRDATGDRLAQDPPQRRARLSHRSAGTACRPADGGRQRLHPSPDAGRRRPLQLARPARGSEPGRRGRRACAGRRGGAFRRADRAGSRRRGQRSPRPPTRSPGSTSPRPRASAPPKGGWCLPATDGRAVPRGRGRPPSGGRGGARARPASASSPMTADWGQPTGCGWSPAPTWAASRPSCGRTR